MEPKRLDRIEDSIEQIIKINRLILQKIDNVLVPDKDMKVSHVVSELRKGNREPWDQLQAANRILYGIKRKRKAVRK